MLGDTDDGIKTVMQKDFLFYVDVSEKGPNFLNLFEDPDAVYREISNLEPRTSNLKSCIY